MSSLPQQIEQKDIIMNARNVFSIVSALGLAIAAQASFAASDSHLVTQDQIDQVRAGTAAAEVTQTLGAPENVTNWMSGERSMVYELSSHNDQQQLVYVDLDKDNKVTDVQVIDR